MQVLKRSDNMNSFVKDLYYGRISPWERDRPKDPEYTNIGRKISKLQEHFKNTLPPEEMKKLEELEILHAQSSSIESYENFVCGFHMGILLTIGAVDFNTKLECDCI